MVGHSAADCKREKRDPNACFKCWKVGHSYKDCSASQYQSKFVAAVGTEGTETQWHGPDERVEFVSEVSVAFRNNVDVLSKCSLFALFDSGSPASFVRASRAPEPLWKHKDATIKTSYYGVNKSPVFAYCKIPCEITFRNRIKTVPLYIVRDDTIGMDILLGRDCLKKFNIYFKMEEDNKDDAENDAGNDRASNKINEHSDSDCSIGTVFPIEDVTEPQRKVLITNVENNDDDILCDSVAQLSAIPEINNLLDKFPPLDLCDRYLVDDANMDLLQCVNNISEPNCLFNIGLADADNRIRNTIESEYTNKIPDKSQVNFELNIQLTDNKPFHYSPRKLSYAEKKAVKNIIDDLLKEKTIQPSDSPYASQIVLVRRKNGQYRMCVDYRTLNKVTVRDNYPLPLIDDCLDHLADKKYFSLLDLKNGFHQVRINPASVKYTSFVTPFGQFEYRKMPFGLKNAPSVFQRFINNIFKDLIYANRTIIYMDDILIATETLDEHIEILKSILNRIKDNNLTLNLEKSKFVYSEIDYLGYTVSTKGISPNLDHKTAILNYKQPTTLQETQSFLGLCSYFRRFIPSFSVIARPLTDLTKNKVIFEFNEPRIEAFKKLKEDLVKAPVLAVYSPDKETELHCDASKIGFGAVILQKQSDKKLHLIFYFSKATSAAEKNYHSFELETLAIIYSLRRFRIYLEGIEFKIVTDCEAFTQTLARKSLNPRIARWALELEHFNYTIVHRSGSKMMHVDALSRITNNSVNAIEDTEIEFQLYVTQNRDENISNLKTRLENEPVSQFELINSVVYRKNPNGKSCLYVPAEMENQIIRRIHEKIGHSGVNKCCDSLCKTYWFPLMKPKVENYIKNCPKCIMYSAKNFKNRKTCIALKNSQFHFTHCTLITSAHCRL